MRFPLKYRARTGSRLALGELRRSLGLSQHELSSRLGISQPHTVKIEHQFDMHVTTLRRYLSGLGGELRLIAEFGDSSYEIALGQGVGDQRKSQSKTKHGETPCTAADHLSSTT